MTHAARPSFDEAYLLGRAYERSTQAVRERFCVAVGMLVGAVLTIMAQWVVAL